MRPREFPAESLGARGRTRRPCPRFNEAAGVPRGIRWRESDCRSYSTGFNEAAGVPRGIPADLSVQGRRMDASMRPREFPAESCRPGSRHRGCCARFNEAAGVPRGIRPTRLAIGQGSTTGFNEAAGVPRGILPTHTVCTQTDRVCFNEAAGVPRGIRTHGARSGPRFAALQ